MQSNGKRRRAARKATPKTDAIIELLEGTIAYGDDVIRSLRRTAIERWDGAESPQQQCQAMEAQCRREHLTAPTVHLPR